MTEEKLSSFIELMITNLRTGSIAFRRAYLRSIIDEVQIHTDKINIIGRKNQLDRAILLGDRKPAGVPSFVRGWRTRSDYLFSYHIVIVILFY
jgi:hypothetical protein